MPISGITQPVVRATMMKVDDPVPPAPPHVIRSASFNGASSRVVVPDGPAFDWSTNFSMGCFAKSTLSGATGTVGPSKWGGGAGGASEFWTYLYGDGTPAAWISANGDNDLVDGSEARPDAPIADVEEWHHYANTFDGSTEENIIYIDGVPVAQTQSGDIATAIANLTGDLTIGGQGSGPLYVWDGNLRDVKLHKGTWTPAQVTIASNGGRVPNDAGYWPLEINSLDYSGNGNHGTPTDVTHGP